MRHTGINQTGGVTNPLAELVITRHCVLKLSDGSRVPAELTIPKSSKPMFMEEIEREFVEKFNASQPNMVNKVVGVHIMRN